MARKKLELNFNDTDDFHFKTYLRGYLIELEDGNYLIVNDDLAIRASGKTPKEAAENIKEQFMFLANEIVYKSKYAALSEREKEKSSISYNLYAILYKSYIDFLI